MKKETIVAVFLGIATGVVIALFLIIQSQNKKTEDKKLTTALISPTVKLPTEEVLMFAVNEPENKFVTNKDTATIKGKAPKGALVVVHSATAERVSELKTDSFAIEFPLSLGGNVIEITAYSNKDTEEKTLTVYYIENE